MVPTCLLPISIVLFVYAKCMNMRLMIAGYSYWHDDFNSARIVCSHKAYGSPSTDIHRIHYSKNGFIEFHSICHVTKHSLWLIRLHGIHSTESVSRWWIESGMSNTLHPIRSFYQTQNNYLFDLTFFSFPVTRRFIFRFAFHSWFFLLLLLLRLFWSRSEFAMYDCFSALLGNFCHSVFGREFRLFI